MNSSRKRNHSIYSRERRSPLEGELNTTVLNKGYATYTLVHHYFAISFYWVGEKERKIWALIWHVLVWLVYRSSEIEYLFQILGVI